MGGGRYTGLMRVSGFVLWLRNWGRNSTHRWLNSIVLLGSDLGTVPRAGSCTHIHKTTSRIDASVQLWRRVALRKLMSWARNLNIGMGRTRRSAWMQMF